MTISLHDVYDNMRFQISSNMNVWFLGIFSVALILILQSFNLRCFWVGGCLRVSCKISRNLTSGVGLGCQADKLSYDDCLWHSRVAKRSDSVEQHCINEQGSQEE